MNQRSTYSVVLMCVCVCVCVCLACTHVCVFVYCVCVSDSLVYLEKFTQSRINNRRHLYTSCYIFGSFNFW